MKQVLLALLFVNIISASFAQSERYTGAMAKNLQAMGEAKTADAMLDAVNAFERIGNAEKTQWLQKITDVKEGVGLPAFVNQKLIHLSLIHI